MKTFNEEMWDLLIEYALAEGILCESGENNTFKWAYVIDENGKKRCWCFDKIDDKILLYTRK